MTDNLAVFVGHHRDDTIAGFSQFIYEFSLGQLTEGRRNDLGYSFPVVWCFISEVNHPHGFEHAAARLATAGLRIRNLNLKLRHCQRISLVARGPV